MHRPIDSNNVYINFLHYMCISTFNFSSMMCEAKTFRNPKLIKRIKSYKRQRTLQGVEQMLKKNLHHFQVAIVCLFQGVFYFVFSTKKNWFK